MIRVRDKLPVERAYTPEAWEPVSVRRRLCPNFDDTYVLHDARTDLWLASFDQPDELDAVVDMVLLRFNAKEVP